MSQDEPQRLPVADSVEQDRKANIITAVKDNDVDTLRQLLNSLEWYHVRDYASDENLLVMSIHGCCREVFNYLLSLPNFPLDMVDDNNETPLIIAIMLNKDYYALELVKKGANVFCHDRYFKPILSCAVCDSNIALVRLLIEKGVDLDGQDVNGDTALHDVLFKETLFAFDLVALLLYHGANPRIRNNDGHLPFETAISERRFKWKEIVLSTTDLLLLEMLFYYTFDQLSVDEISISTFLLLAQCESPLINGIRCVIMDNNPKRNTSYRYLLLIDEKYLKILLENFADAVKGTLPFIFSCIWPWKLATIEKLDFLLNSDLRDDVISGIQNINVDDIFDSLGHHQMDESQITVFFCYLLSYGLNVTEKILETVYEKYGFCELFEILLYMDIQKGTTSPEAILPQLFFDVAMDPESYMLYCWKFSFHDVLDSSDALLDYFSNQELVQLVRKVRFPHTKQEAIDSKINRLPQVPLLVQLARDVFRKYFIHRLKIKNSRQFYTFLKHLPIGEVYKRIITFQKKLYE